MWNLSIIDGPIDVPIYGPPDEEGNREVIGHRDGYHLNVSPEIMTSELEQFVIEPETPNRIFFGGETTFLKFPNEASAKSHLSEYWNDE